MSQIYTTTIKVCNPEKIGEGFSAYVRYTLTVETDNPKFNGNTFEVHRRFREFHALYETLVDLYRHKGYHIPHPPEKSISTSTLVKIQNKVVAESTKVEQRRLALERFINRLANHPFFGSEDLVVEFLTQLVSTVKARDSMVKLKTNITSTFVSFRVDLEDYDQWFEEKMEKLSNLESAISRVHSVSQDMHALREELVHTSQSFVLSLNDLRGAEQNPSIATALASLSELKEKSVELYTKQCLSDLHNLVGTCKDVLDDLISVKHLLNTYQNKYLDLKALETKCEKQKEKLLKIQNTSPAVEVQALKNEIEEFEKKIKFSTNSLEEFYNKLKEEINYFEQCRVRDMRKSFLSYMHHYKQFQTDLLGLWEKLLPVCTAIN